MVLVASHLEMFVHEMLIDMANKPNKPRKRVISTSWSKNHRNCFNRSDHVIKICPPRNKHLSHVRERFWGHWIDIGSYIQRLIKTPCHWVVIKKTTSILKQARVFGQGSKVKLTMYESWEVPSFFKTHLWWLLFPKMISCKRKTVNFKGNQWPVAFFGLLLGSFRVLLTSGAATFLS